MQFCNGSRPEMEEQMLTESRKDPWRPILQAVAVGIGIIILFAAGLLYTGCKTIFATASDENWNVIYVDDEWEDKWKGVVFLYYQPYGSPPQLVKVELVPLDSGQTVVIDHNSTPPEDMEKWRARFLEFLYKPRSDQRPIVIKAADLHRMPFSF